MSAMCQCRHDGDDDLQRLMVAFLHGAGPQLGWNRSAAFGVLAERRCRSFELGPHDPAFGLSAINEKSPRSTLRHLPLVTELAALSRNFRLTGHVLKGGNTMRDIRVIYRSVRLDDEQIRAVFPF